jgi:hypothetical protein
MGIEKLRRRELKGKNGNKTKFCFAVISVDQLWADQERQSVLDDARKRQVKELQISAGQGRLVILARAKKKYIFHKELPP